MNQLDEALIFGGFTIVIVSDNSTLAQVDERKKVMKTPIKASAFLSVLTVAGAISLATVAPAQAQSVCSVNRFNQTHCRSVPNRYDSQRYDWRSRNNFDRRSDYRQPFRYGQNVRWQINDIYREVLDRNLDPSGWRTWTRSVREGNSLDDVRRDVARSQEAQNRINQIYRDVLGRDADAGGLETWTRALEDGRSLNEVRRAIENSQESRNRSR
jgi:hypothetical protein